MEPSFPPPPRPRRDWSPSLWVGCDAYTWARLLWRHRFAVQRSRWHIAAVVSAVSVAHSVLGLLQQALYRCRVAHTPVGRAPVFILGHWRSGTTFLHELLACDPEHAFPTTYECFAPHHSLLTGSWLPRLFGRLMPGRRPMDNMAAGWGRPQEDEFALCLLGQPSPYERLAFPNCTEGQASALDLRGLSPAALRRWKTVYFQLIQEWTLAKGGRRLVLKSPPHTCRIPTLLELFPGARFVHLIRDPYDLYPSTLHLWRVLYGVHALQRPSWEGLPEYVLATFEQMYRRFEEDKRLVPASQLHELRYEDLVADPVAKLEAIYQALELGDFDRARPHVQAHLAGVKGYERNRYVLTPAERRAVTRRWGDVIRRYGYPLR
jgi:hypothetical protein